MKCGRIKELLLTDYIDDSIDVNLKESFNSHITGCRACRDYKMKIDKGFFSLFKEPKVNFPQDEIWQNIKTSIEDRQKRKGKVFVLNPFLRKSVFAFAAAAALIFIVTTFKVINISQRAAVNNFLLQESYFLYSLSGYNSQGDFNQTNFGTIIEEYLL
jgi:anti-sigma factor RsiW